MPSSISKLLRNCPFRKRRCVFGRLTTYASRRSSSSNTRTHPLVPVDELCIPLHPVESPSVSDGSSSTPCLSDEELIRLHHLSGLKPPPTSSLEFDQLKFDLLAMLKVVDTVKTFPLDLASRGIREADAQELALINGNSQSVPWDAIIETQAAFIKSKAEKIPGTQIWSKSRPSETEETTSSEAALVIRMGRADVHLVKRKGIGQFPEKEGLYYALKPLRGRNM